MNESNKKRKVIVGLFVFGSLVFFALSILVVGNLRNTFERKIELVSLFDDVAGLKKGNNIWLSGVKVGIVSDMAFYDLAKVKVTMKIDEKAKEFIPSDSKVKISTDGLIGNTILVIYGGTNAAAKIVEGDTLKVEKTFSSEDMLSTLQKSNKNFLEITENLKTITGKIARGEGTVGKLMNDDQAYTALNTVLQTTQKSLSGARQMIASLNTLVAKFNKDGNLVNELATDTLMFNSIKQTVGQLEEISASASAVVTALKSDIHNPNSPVGILLKDQQTGSSLKATMENLEQSSANLNKELDALQYSTLFKKLFKKKAAGK